MTGLDRTTRPVPPAPHYLALIVLAAVACDAPYRAASTAQMASLLDSVMGASAADPLIPTNSAAKVEVLRNREVPPDMQSRLIHRAQLAEALLPAGALEEAIATFEDVLRDITSTALNVPPAFAVAVNDQLAIAYLRQAQVANCRPELGSAPCLFPIPDEARHTDTTAARAAIRIYEAALRDYPDDLVSHWLLNIAYMMVGEYPHGVPIQWRIPEEAISSAYDIGRFPDVAPQLGLNTRGLAGGSVTSDFDRDGYIDIMASSRGFGDQIRYFKNNGDGTFEDRTVAAGLEGLVGGLNILSTDYNNDGFTDVLVLRGAWLPRGHPNSLLRNNGDGTFDDVTEAAGLFGDFPTQAAVWADFDNDGWLDVFIGNETTEGPQHPSQLFINNGDGTFTEMARQAGVAVVGFVKGVAAGDYDNDGLSDLYVSRLGEWNLLFHNNGLGGGGYPTFSEVGLAAGVRQPLASLPTWFFDYDNDGWEDLIAFGFSATSGDIAAEYLGRSHGATLSHLYRNSGDGTFTDVTAETGLDKIFLAMGSNFGDLDNDGFLDIFVGTGNPDFRALVPNRVFRNAGGAFFQDVAASGWFGHLQKGHGVSFADLDNDGDQDIYMVLGGANEGDFAYNALFANPGHGNRWITLQLEGVQSNRIAIGARIHVIVDTPRGPRNIHVTVNQGGNFGASSLRQEIGLGDATAIRQITIRWPASGITDVYTHVALDQMVHIREGADAPTPVQLGTFDLINPGSGR